MRVVFLDIDGVLNNSQYIQRVRKLSVMDPDSVSELNRVLIETGAMIVVSSTWRYMYALDSKTGDRQSLNELFVLNGIIPDRVIGVTPMTLKYGRGQEIALWLADYPEVDDWVAVDDDTDMDPLPPYRVVKTDFETGLQREHADRMIQILMQVGSTDASG